MPNFVSTKTTTRTTQSSLLYSKRIEIKCSIIAAAIDVTATRERDPSFFFEGGGELGGIKMFPLPSPSHCSKAPPPSLSLWFRGSQPKTHTPNAKCCTTRGPQPPTVACKNGSSVWTARGGGQNMESDWVHPTSNGGMQTGSSVGIRTRRTHVFCTLGADLHAQSVIIDENFCSGAQSEVY